MSPLNQDVIQQHLSELEEAVSYLKTKHAITERDIIQNYELRLAIERALHLAIQNTIDIGNHILAMLNIRDIDTYADIPDKLAEAKILPKALAQDLTAMTRFRNILVHEYVRVESRKLIDFLKNNLSDFDEFARAIIAWLSTERSE